MYFIYGFKFMEIKVSEIWFYIKNSKSTYSVFLGHLEFCEDVDLLFITLLSFKIDIARGYFQNGELSRKKVEKIRYTDILLGNSSFIWGREGQPVKYIDII